MEMEWELVSSKAELWRCKIDGGWLVKHFQMYKIAMQEKGSLAPAQVMPLNAAVAMAFVPDVNHQWKIEKAQAGDNNSRPPLTLLKP